MQLFFAILLLIVYIVGYKYSQHLKTQQNDYFVILLCFFISCIILRNYEEPLSLCIIIYHIIQAYYLYHR